MRALRSIIPERHQGLIEVYYISTYLTFFRISLAYIIAMRFTNNVVPFLVRIFHLHTILDVAFAVKVIWFRIAWVALVPREICRNVILVVVPTKFPF